MLPLVVVVLVESVWKPLRGLDQVVEDAHRWVER
jgi:hypothetical protein